MIASVLWIALVAQVPGDVPTQLAQLEAAVEQRPDDAAAHFALGRLLARTYLDEAAIPLLQRAVKLGLPAADSDHARMLIPLLLFEFGRDREAADAFARLLKEWPEGHIQRAYVQGRLGAIARRHAALEGVTESETRATILIGVALVFLVFGFWGGRRRARRQEIRA